MARIQRMSDLDDVVRKDFFLMLDGFVYVAIYIGTTTS